MEPALAARAAADRLLKVRPRSEQELRRRLRMKGIPEPVIDAVVQELTRQGRLNDRQFAQYMATGQLLAKPVGVRALRDALRRKGITPEVVEEAVGKATVGYDEVAAARELASRRVAQWAARLPVVAVRRRLLGLLQRRGFSSEVVYRVVREVVGGEEQPGGCDR